MHFKTMSCVIATAVALATTATADTSVQALMKEKLESAHGVLDAIAMGDFAKVEVFAGRLKDVSRVTTWYRQDSEDFLMFAKSFQNSAAFLAERAKAKDSEGVAMGYVRMTLDCIQCHEVVRAKLGKK